MRILWHSVAPWMMSGYGQQTALFSRALVERGHDVMISSWAGLRGGALPFGESIKVVPGSTEQGGIAGLDLLVEHATRYQPDAIVILMDAWPLDADVLRHLPCALWAPVDQEPIPPAVVSRLLAVDQPLAMSRHGLAQMKKTGCTRAAYVPHAVSAQVFHPQDRVESRRAWGLSGSAFVAVMAATNDSFPSRKGLDRAIKAWGRFSLGRDAVLYLHTPPDASFGGYDLPGLARLYGVDSAKIRFTEPYRLACGGVSPGEIARLYSAADVLLAPSAGEGFCIPMLEAQACGCPVIASDFTAQAEMNWAGWKLEVDRFDDMTVTFLGCEQAMVRPSRIVAALEQAWEARGDAALRERAIAGAVEYEIEVVAGRMVKVLEGVAGGGAGTSARRA